MLVKCKENSLDGLSPEKLAKVSGWFGTGFGCLNLTVGKCYVVYAVTFRQGTRWFFVADDLYQRLLYPVAYPDFIFEVIGFQISKLWESNPPEELSDSSSLEGNLYSFEGWNFNNIFYENMLNEDELVLRTFRQSKEMMDLEFPCDDNIKQAVVLEDRWVSCSECEDSWEEASDQGMVRCPNCKEILNNPFYIGKTGAQGHRDAGSGLNIQH